MKICWTFALAATLATSAFAASIVNSTGLSSPASTVTFEEIVLAPGTALTNQYAGLGVTFSGAFYDTQTCPFPGFGGAHCAGNMNTNPFSIFFTTPQTSAAIAFATNPVTTTVTAFLLGVQVEQFSQATDFAVASTAFLGFSGIAFDQIQFSVAGDGAAVFDNIQTGDVPEPATFVLAGLALSALRLARRRTV